MKYLNLILFCIFCPLSWGQFNNTYKEILNYSCKEYRPLYNGIINEHYAYLTLFPQSNIYTYSHRLGIVESGIYSQNGDTLFFNPKTILDCAKNEPGRPKAYSADVENNYDSSFDELIAGEMFLEKKIIVCNIDTLVEIYTNDYSVDTSIKNELFPSEAKSKEEGIEILNKSRRSFSRTFTRIK